MRILHVITNLTSGGAEKLIFDIVPRMVKEGNQVDIVVLFDKNNIYIDDLLKVGIRVKVLTYNNRFNPINLIKLIGLIKKSKYNIVHTHLFPALYFSSLTSIFCRDVKFIYTEHSTYNKRRDKRYFKLIEKFIYSRFDKIICISKKTEENLRNHIQDNTQKIVTIENGVDLKKFEDAIPLKKLEISPNLKEKDKIITMIGRFSYQKDQLTVIRTMKLLPSNYKLLLIGEGPNKSKCEEEVCNLKLQDQVIFLGMRKDVPNILKTSDISVLSSIWEGFGLVAVESMAAGIPVIGTNVDGLREVIGNNEYLFEVGDQQMLALKIIKILIDKEEKNKEYFKQNAQKYSIEQMIKKYIFMYYN